MELKKIFYQRKGRKLFTAFRLTGYFSYITLRPKSCNMSHITKEQRYTIRVMKEQNCSQKKIAETIGKDKSVISREFPYVCFFNVSVYGNYMVTDY